MVKHRLRTSLIAGAMLGFFCIIGASVRSGFELDASYLFAFWYNRVIMGLIIGLACSESVHYKLILRGAFFGLIVSFAFYSSTAFHDLTGFIAGGFYGVIIEYTAFRFKS